MRRSNHTPSPRYSGERAGERGPVRAISPHRRTARTLPLSLTLSPQAGRGNWILILLILFTSVSAIRANQRPNVIVIMTDDQAQWALSCYGNTDCPTPN